MQKHSAVFEVNADGAEQWQGILNNIENLQKTFGHGTTRWRSWRTAKAWG